MSDDLEKAFSRSRKAAKARGKNYKPAKADNTQTAIERAKDRQLTEENKRIDVLLQKEKNRRRYSTKKDITERVRKEIKQGKVKKGTLQKTVERRWKATKRRKSKFEAEQRAKKVALKKQAKKKVSKLTKKKLGVTTVAAMITFQISNDKRVVNLTFSGSSETLWGDAEDALKNYMQSDEGFLLDVVEL